MEVKARTTMMTPNYRQTLDKLKTKNMKKITVHVSWYEKNFGASLGEEVPGAVVLTAKTFEELQQAVPETLRFHVEGLLEDEDEEVPEWLAKGDYEFEWDLDTAALLQVCSQYATLAAISRASGVNERQLSHYANGTKKPRQPQRQRIVEGLHKIGRSLMTFM